MPLYCYHSPATGSNYLYHSVHSFSSAVVGMVVRNDETDKEWNGMMAQPFLCEEEVINICLPFENRQLNNKIPISSFHNSLTLRWADESGTISFRQLASALSSDCVGEIWKGKCLEFEIRRFWWKFYSQNIDLSVAIQFLLLSDVSYWRQDASLRNTKFTSPI